MKIELRTINAIQPATLDGRTLSGIAIPYNALSHDLGGFREQFAPGSVTETIKSGMIEASAHHDRSRPVGSQAAGNLKLTDSPEGLRYSLTLPEGNTDAANIISLAKPSAGGKPVIGGTSFGFRIAGGESGQRWTRSNGENIRTVVAADIEHISPVVTPAYPQTSAVLRSMIGSGIDFNEYGIDLAKLAGIFIARNKGMEIDKDERELARVAIELLSTAKVNTPKLSAAIAKAARILI